MAGTSSIPSAMLTEVQGESRVYHTLDLTLGGSTLSFADVNNPVSSDAGGNYLPSVRSFGRLSRGIGYPAISGLQNPRVRCVIEDETRALQESIGGPAAGEVIGSSASITLRSPHVAAANHYTRISGEIKDYELVSDRVWSVVLGPNTTSLDSPLKIPRLTKDDWPAVPAGNRDLSGRMIFGEWDSTDRPARSESTPRCLIEAHLVDPDFDPSTGNGYGYWYVCFGHLPDSSITTVFVDGADDTADWTMTRILQNGRPYTVLEQTAGTAFTISNEVTFDCLGLGATGDASGSIERDPADVLKIVLGNVVFGEYPVNANPGGGTDPGYQWLVDTTNIDTTSFTAASTYLTTLNHELARIYTSDDTGFDVIREWMTTFRCPVFWGDSFKLKIGCFEFFERDIYSPHGHIQQYKLEALKPLQSRTFGENRRNRAVVNYMFDPGANKYDRSVFMSDEDVNYTAEEVITYAAGGPSSLDIG